MLVLLGNESENGGRHHGDGSVIMARRCTTTPTPWKNVDAATATPWKNAGSAPQPLKVILIEYSGVGPRHGKDGNRLGPYEYVVWLAVLFDEIAVLVCAFKKDALRRYILLKCTWQRPS